MDSRYAATSDDVRDVSKESVVTQFSQKDIEVHTVFITYLLLFDLDRDLPRVCVSYITAKCFFFSTKLKQEVFLNVKITLLCDLDHFLCSGLSKDPTKENSWSPF